MKKDCFFWGLAGLSALGTALGTYRIASGQVGLPAAQEPRLAVPAAPEAAEDGAPSGAGGQTPRPRDGGARSRGAPASRTLVPAPRARVVPPAEPAAEPGAAAPASGGEAAAGLAGPGRMPLVEMDWDQYRAWAKYGDALGREDYKSAAEMIPRLEEVFSREMMGHLIDALAQDYEQYLSAVVEAGCDGHDPESVWRKTMFMSLVLARFERQSIALEQQAAQARLVCGYDK
ncbi:MAG: hypothetical protein HY744_14060 [Deltaproteobacteria bacterium]|nr:hypothetical protein [Deltaproteobacteria bacterium]